MEEALGQLVDPDGGLTEKAEDELDEAHRSGAPKPFRRMRRRVGSEEFGEVLQALLLVVSGHVDQLGPSSLARVEHALGTDRARSDLLGSTGRPWLDGDVRDDMVNIGRLIDPVRLGHLVDKFSDAELDVARDEVRLFASGISSLARFMRMTMDNWAYGMAAWGLNFDEIVEDPPGQAMLILMWLSCKEAGLGEGMAAILDAVRAQPAMGAQFDVLIQLREAVPAVGKAVPLKWLGKPMRDPSFPGQSRVSGRRAIDARGPR
jgi:hypothetical protein